MLSETSEISCFRLKLSVHYLLHTGLYRIIDPSGPHGGNQTLAGEYFDLCVQYVYSCFAASFTVFVTWFPRFRPHYGVLRIYRFEPGPVLVVGRRLCSGERGEPSAMLLASPLRVQLQLPLGFTSRPINPPTLLPSLELSHRRVYCHASGSTVGHYDDRDAPGQLQFPAASPLRHT